MNEVSDVNNLGLLLTDHIQAMLSYWDKDQVCRFANAAYLEWFGKTHDEVVDKMTIKELLGPLYNRNLPHITGVLAGKAQQFERDVEMPNGEIKYTQAILNPDTRDNEVKGFFAHITDISKAKKLEKELYTSEQKFKGLLESAPDAIVIVNMAGEIQLINAQTEKLFGYKRSELFGEKIRMLVPEHSQESLNNFGSNFFLEHDKKAAGTGLELYGLHKNGDEFPVEVNINPIQLNDGLYISAAIRDITDRIAHERDLNEMAIIIASSSDAIISKTLDGMILTWNKGAEKILGYSFEEAKGRHVSMLFPPDLLYEEEILIAKILNGESVEQFETVRIRKDQSKIDVSITLSAIKDKVGNVIGISKILRDITTNKRAERELKALLEITTEQNNRLKNFAYIVSHNLRSHSGNISILLNMYANKFGVPEGEKIMSHLKSASFSLTETIENLNEVVLINTAVGQNLVSIDLHKAIDSAIGNVSQLAKEAGVRVKNELGKHTEVLGLPAYMDSILLNFITNGIKYRSKDRPCVITFSTTKQGNFVVLSIEDNGLGIDLKKYGDKIFGMYKTFHGNKDARGIGLFITKNQIEAMSARVEVESEPDKGTTFKIHFKHE